MTPVSITGTSLSSTCTSRMVLSICERLAGSRLQGTHRWITCRGQQKWQLLKRRHPVKFYDVIIPGQVGHRGQINRTQCTNKILRAKMTFIANSTWKKQISQKHHWANSREPHFNWICALWIVSQVRVTVTDLHVLPCPLRGSSLSSRSVLLSVSSSRQATAAPSASIGWCSPAPGSHLQSVWITEPQR